MNTALLLLGVLAITDGFTTQPITLNYTKMPRIPKDGFTTTQLPLNYSKEPRIPGRIPQFKLPANVPMNIIPCSKRLKKVTLAPGDSATFQSPNYPANYAKSKCKWQFRSTEDIIISCSNFILESANKRGKCKDSLKIGPKKYCGTSSPYLHFTAFTALNIVTVQFKSNRRKHYSGFSCTAMAKSSTTIDPNPGSTTTVKSSFCKCGQANRANRIVNGVETEVNEYPWQAGLVYRGTNQVFCGASVIGSKHLLTAAHCTQAITDQGFNYQVIVGAHGLTSHASSHLTLDANRFIQHSAYDDSTYDNDISIIVLRDSISFINSEVRPICIPNNDANSYASVTATVAGWGTTTYQGSQPDVLMEVDVPTMTNTKCRSYYQGGISGNMLCAGYAAGGKDSCQGDSGGPLIYKSGSGYTQIGVVSWGYGCAWAGSPGVYARVSKYLSWISSNSASSTTCPAA